MEWNHALVDEIRATKERQKSEDRDGLLGLLKFLPGEKVHYAYELLQNADDEGATRVEFRFTDEGLVVSNDGEPFTTDDVWSVCSAGVSRKRRKIGFFGVGFKSVFEVTEIPQVISGDFNFEIRDFILPHPRNDIPPGVRYELSRGSSFVLRYGKNTKDDLRDTLSTLNARLLLFLNTVVEVRVAEGIDGPAVWQVTKTQNPDGSVLIEDSRAREAERWFVFKKSLAPPANVQGRQPVDETEIAIGVAPGKAEQTKQEPVYCYLPTRKQAGAPFLLQADFTPTLGRENVKEDNWDDWLFEQLGQLAAEVIVSLKESPDIGSFLYDFIPLVDEVSDRQVRSTVKAMHTALRQMDFVRGAHGAWLRPSEACLSPSDLQALLTPSQLFGRRRVRLHYVYPLLPPRAWTVLAALGVVRFDVEELVHSLRTPKLLRNQELPSLLRLYGFLARRLSDGSPSSTSLAKELGSCRFLFTYDERWVAPGILAETGRLLAYPAKMTRTQLRTLPGRDLLAVLHPFFELSSVKGRKTYDGLESERTHLKNFLESHFGVLRSLTVAQVVLGLVVRKLMDPTTPDGVVLRLLDFVRSNVNRFVKEARKHDRTKTEAGILAELGRKLHFPAVSQDGSRQRLPLVSLYVPYGPKDGEGMRDLFSGVQGVWYVAPSVLRKRVARGELTWASLLGKLGAWTSPRVNHEPGPIELDDHAYRWLKREYSPPGIHEVRDDFTSPDTDTLLSHCEALPSEEAAKRYDILWNSLARNWDPRYQDASKARYRWDYWRKMREKEVRSSFIHTLRTAAWVLGVDARFHKPKDLIEDSPANRHILGDAVAYAAWTGPRAMLDALGIRREPKLDAALDRLVGLQTMTGKNLLDTIVPIYRFLHKETKDDPQMQNELARRFEKSSLIYIPRTDRGWWKPSACYWVDYEHVFRRLRGYLEPVYAREHEEFFELIGARTKPDLPACFALLSELSAGDDSTLQETKTVLPDLYKFMARLLSMEQPKTQPKAVTVLAEDGRWLPPANVYFADDARRRAVFPDLPYIYAPVPAVTVGPLLEFLGIPRLSRHARIRKLPEGQRAAPSDVNETIRTVCKAVSQDLRRRAEPVPHAEGWFELSSTIEVFLCESIKVPYEFRHGRDRRRKTMWPDYFYSADENRLYVCDEAGVFDVECAAELSRLFEPHADDAQRTLSALLVQARSEDQLSDALDALGLGSSGLQSSSPAAVAYLPPGATEPGTASDSAPVVAKSTIVPQAPPTAAPVPLPSLKDPNRLKIGQVHKRTPYKPEEGGETEKREVVRKPTSGVRRPAVARHSVGPTKQAVEQSGHKVVEMVELRAGRTPLPVAGEKEVGYDYESGDRKIEVKDSQLEDPPAFSLNVYELKAAEELGDSYWVYVVTGLREGATTKVYAVRNPLKFLIPREPEFREFFDWKAAVLEEFELVEETDQVQGRGRVENQESL